MSKTINTTALINSISERCESTNMKSERCKSSSTITERCKPMKTMSERLKIKLIQCLQFKSINKQYGKDGQFINKFCENIVSFL